MTQPRTLISGGVLEDGSTPHILVDSDGRIIEVSEREGMSQVTTSITLISMDVLSSPR